MEEDLSSVYDKQSNPLVVLLNFIHKIKINKFLKRWTNDYISYKNVGVLKWHLYYVLKSVIFLCSLPFVERTPKNQLRNWDFPRYDSEI